MILMYHKVDLRSPTKWWVDVSSFYRHMCLLEQYEVVYLDEYAPGNERQAVITFDGVYKNVLEYAVPILRDFGYPFELFVSSDLIGATNHFDRIEPAAAFASREDLSKMVESGGRLQWHTRTHPMLKQSKLDPDWGMVERELIVPEDLSDLDPGGFKWFAYPYGEFSPDVYRAVKDHFSGAVSCYQGNDTDLYCLNRETATNASRFGERTICVIVVSHNYGDFLAEAIESVLGQTFMPDTILVMDDASSDATCSIGQRYASLYPELISYVRNEERLGIVDTFNRAVAHTKSDFICFLGGDNRLSSNYIELCMRSMLRSDVAVAYTDFRLFGPNAREEYFKHGADRRARVIDDQFYEIVFPEFSRKALLEGNFIHGSAVYSREAFEAVGGYLPRRAGRPEDANLFQRMAMAGFPVKKVSGAWLEYRQHSDAQANIVSRTQGELEFYRAYARRLEFKVKALELTFGSLSPIVRALSIAETLLFETLVKVARIWRRLFR